MTSPLCKYSGCERPIEQGQYGAEGDEAYADRVRLGYCRKKCQRLDKPSPSPRDRPALVADPTSWNLGAVETVPVGKDKPVRDAARLAFARSMPCCICGSIEAVHSHHEQEEGQGTMGGKTCDRRTLPLCWRCHCRRHDKGREVYGALDVERVIAEINAAYDERRK